MKFLGNVRENPLYCISWIYFGFFVVIAITGMRYIENDQGAWIAHVITALIFLMYSEIIGTRAEIRDIRNKLKEKN